MKRIVTFLKNSVLLENTSLLLMLGLCPLLAVSTAVIDGLIMGLCVIVALVLSSVTISLIARFIPKSIRVIAYMVIIATFVAAEELLIRAFLPGIAENLGIYLPLITVSGIVFAQSERATEEGVGASALNALSAGLGFFATMFVMSFVRELIGNGTLCGLRIIPEQYCMRLIISPPGAFITFGLLLAVFNMAVSRIREKEGEE